MKFVWASLRSVAIFAAIYLGIALVLIVSQRPGAPIEGKTLQFGDLAAVGNHTPTPTTQFTLRDGAEIPVRVHSGTPQAPLVVLLHGSGGFGSSYDWLAAQINQKSGATVLVPDLRGHGANANPRGDLAYVGQFEDDLADLMNGFRQDGQKRVMAGHSSGGGLAIRFAGGAHGGMLDGAILLSPFLKYNAPTMRPNAGGWARVLTRRTIGLVMLNMVGITAFNGLTSIEFNLPEGEMAQNMTGAYSYRLNTSYAPRNDYGQDIAALPPYLLIVGAQDEAFLPDQFEPTMTQFSSKGQYEVLNGVSHLDVFLKSATVDQIVNYLDEL